MSDIHSLGLVKKIFFSGGNDPICLAKSSA